MFFKTDCLLINILIVIYVLNIKVNAGDHCREKSSQMRHDGGLCFEILPWQHQPVELQQHLEQLRQKLFSNETELRRQIQLEWGPVKLANNEVSRYMDTVIAPFLDTYHRNIQSSYQQLTSKLLRRIKEHISAAVVRKQEIYSNLTKLADELNVPEMCDEERRLARTLASQHVAHVYSCTENARAAIAKMASYAENMILITKNHIQETLSIATRRLQLAERTEVTVDIQIEVNPNIGDCLKELARATVILGYELDLSLTNARRHNEHSCERLTSCIARARKISDEEVARLTELLYQCVYA